MIGTHNSYSFQKAKLWILNLFSFLWRCQTKNINEQIKSNVEYFDVRVRYDKKSDCWRTCHGIVDFRQCFKRIENITEKFKDKRLRIILERYCDYGWYKFRSQIDVAQKKYGNIYFSAAKKGWKILIDNDKSLIDYTFVPWLSDLSFFKNILNHNFFSTIKRWAKKHNPEITSEIINDSTIHFMDMV